MLLPTVGILRKLNPFPSQFSPPIRDPGLLRDALESLGFSESEQDDLFKVIAGLLQFSNVAFKDAEVNGGEGSKRKLIILKLSLQNLIQWAP